MGRSTSSAPVEHLRTISEICFFSLTCRNQFLNTKKSNNFFAHLVSRVRAFSVSGDRARDALEKKTWFRFDCARVEYQTWKADHTKCKANFQGSAPAMEPEGADRIFRSSVEQHNLRYTEFYGDGDSKSYNRVKGVYQDAGIEVEKKECIGHVQKRVGTALRKLKRDNPGLGGKGKLTDSQIDKLQNYYGIAIRSNVGNLAGMKKAIHASFMHCASSEARLFHDQCPTGSTSWCRYQQDKANRTNLYKHGTGLPLAVIKEVKPEYVRLTEDNLLKKYLHGKTRNQNESLNGMVWQRIPKEVYVGSETLQLGLYDAVAISILAQLLSLSFSKP